MPEPETKKTWSSRWKTKPEELMDIEDALALASILVSIALIAIILLQVKGEGVGGLQSGSFVRTRRGLEKTLFQLTIVLSVLWMGIAALAVYVR